MHVLLYIGNDHSARSIKAWIKEEGDANYYLCYHADNLKTM